MEGCPDAKLFVIPSLEYHFLWRPLRQSMRIDGEDLLAAVFLPLDECVEQSALVFSNHILKNAGIQVVLQFLAQIALQVVQLSGSRRAPRRSSRCFLDLLVRF